MSRTGQFTPTHPPKICKTCGGEFFKRSKVSLEQWAKTQFCSNVCRGSSHRLSERVMRDGRVKVWHQGKLRWRYHVVVETKLLGRPLRVGEVVDHINGDPSDDRPENLRVFGSHAEHMRTHWAEGTIHRGASPQGGSVARSATSEWPASREAA